MTAAWSNLRSTRVRLRRRRTELVDGDRRQPIEGNGAHLYVLADKRLLLVRSDDPYANQVLVSTASDWTTLARIRRTAKRRRNKYISVNRDGIASTYFPVEVFDDGDIGDNAGRARHPGTFQHRPDELADHRGTRRVTAGLAPSGVELPIDLCWTTTSGVSSTPLRNDVFMMAVTPVCA